MNEVTSALELINQRVRKLEAEASAEKHAEHREAIKDLHDRVNTVEKKAEMTRHCPGCGEVVGRGSKFCRKCGKKL
jgi:predicted RNA-binding Zn-ribbon protein involved in translation (DUF1610 family)